ncbi:MAG: M64 family metallopeptidase [Myxococcota bacterium]
MSLERSFAVLLVSCCWLACEEDTTWHGAGVWGTYGGALNITCTPSAGGNPNTGGGGISGARDAASETPAGAAGEAPQTDAGGVRFVPGRVAARSVPPLDCGPNGVAIENAGPPLNRVNYVLLGDGYDARSVNRAFLAHIAEAMKRRFSTPTGEPYGRYRKFVNICALKVPSASDGIGNGPTAFGCNGSDTTRLAACNTSAAEAALDAELPETFEVDWHAIMLNSERPWGTGSTWALWSAANEDAPGIALHEGGHGFHHLADEYTELQDECEEFEEVNTTADAIDTNGKWKHWLGYDAVDATGMQCIFQGSGRCRFSASQFRSSNNSMMNSLYSDAKSSSFNAVSREKIIMDIWRRVRPIDGIDPEPGEVLPVSTLRLELVDENVISVDWSVDGILLAKDGGPSYDLSASRLPPGTHTIAARVYDNADETWVRARNGCGNRRLCWNRDAWKNSEQVVTWTVTVP